MVKLLNYVQIIHCIKAAYKEYLAVNPTEYWHHFNTLINQADGMLSNKKLVERLLISLLMLEIK